MKPIATTAFLLSIFAAGIAACDGPALTSVKVSVAEVKPAPSQTPSTNAKTAMPEVSSGKAYANLKDLYLKSSNGVQVDSTYEFGGRFADEAKYKDIFGAKHVQMTQQMVKIGANQGGITFVEFPSEAEAVSATKAHVQNPQRPSAKLQYGKFVVLIQVQSGDLLAFTRDLKAILDKP